MTLVEDLRDAAECLLVPVPKDAAGYVYYAEAQLCLKAADRIEVLEAENAELRQRIAAFAEMVKALRLMSDTALTSDRSPPADHSS